MQAPRRHPPLPGTSHRARARAARRRRTRSSESRVRAQRAHAALAGLLVRQDSERCLCEELLDLIFRDIVGSKLDTRMTWNESCRRARRRRCRVDVRAFDPDPIHGPEEDLDPLVRLEATEQQHGRRGRTGQRLFANGAPCGMTATRSSSHPRRELVHERPTMHDHGGRALDQAPADKTFDFC